MKLTTSGESTLLQALQRLVPGASNRTLRQMLQQGRVRVCGVPCGIAARALHAGDLVEVGAAKKPDSASLHGIQVVHEDDDLLVILKPGGLLTVSTALEKERTVYALLRARARENRSKPPWVVHRLDKFVSGLLVFAKSRAVRERLRALFKRHDIERRYWAIVEGRVAPDEGTVQSDLAESRATGRMQSAPTGGGKRSVTHFRVLRRFADLTSLEVTLETGRKNQIRVHLSEMGHPIAGDRAYGSKTNPLGRIGLHAFVLGFRHPRTGQQLSFRSEPPPEFRRYLPGAEGTRRSGAVSDRHRRDRQSHG